MNEDFRFKYSSLQKMKQEGRPFIFKKKLPKMTHCVNYRVLLEDHTLGDLLRIHLLKRKDVKFAGYRQAHPLVEEVQIKVQTASEQNEKIVKETLSSLQKELLDLESLFDDAINYIKDPTCL